MSGIMETGFQKAIQVLRANVTRYGLKASQAYYTQVWARDSFISFLGANLLKDRILLDACKTTIKVLSSAQSPLGQIPNFIDPRDGRADYGPSGATDATAWFLIGLAQLYKVTNDAELLKKYLWGAVAAYKWLRHQDSNNTLLIDSPEGADWMDAAIQRTGKTLYNNALFYEATRSVNYLIEEGKAELKPPYVLDSKELKLRFLDVFWPTKRSLSKIAHFWPAYKDFLSAFPSHGAVNHFIHFISFARIDRHFDSLSNFLAIIFGLATKEQRNRILDYADDVKIATPYPVRVLHPLYEEGDPAFKKEHNQWLPIQHRSDAYAYQNGGVWPFVGGFYALALNTESRSKARALLEKLAAANKIGKQEVNEWGFIEWFHGKTGKPVGQVHQSWNAGTYIAAYLTVVENTPLAIP